MEVMISSPLKVEVDTVIPSLDFRIVQQELASQGKRFGKDSLQKIPYSQLHLCCIGPAGAAACSPRLVYLEKERRLDRFVSLAPETLKDSERWLKAEGMFDDVMAEVSAKAAPEWDNLKPRQRVVALLFCLYNHVDDPEERVVDAVAFIKESAGDGIPPMLGSELCSKLVNLTRRFLGLVEEDKQRITSTEFREGIFQVIEAILNILSKEEAMTLMQEKINGFSCTSDCFRVY
jgi:hypothetical protein